MKKAVKITVISVAAIAVILIALFVVIPFASSKEAKARLSEALAGAGIPDDMWSAERVYYVPVFGHLVVEKFEIGGILEANKITMAIKTNSENVFAGSINAQRLSFLADGTDIVVKSLSVKDFSVDTVMFGDNPLESFKRLGKVSVSGTTFRQSGQTYFTLGEFNANVGYSEGKTWLPASVTLKNLTADVRRFNSLSALRPEYRISTLKLKNSLSGAAYKINLIMDVDDLFAIKTDLGISFPLEFDEIADFTAIDYGEDVKLDSLTLTYTDKSFLEHIFELAELPGGKEAAAESLNDSIMMIAELGGIDAERFASESAGFLKKPGKLELKTNLESPVSFEDIGQNPFAVNLSLSINGGKPFTTDRY
ncbi:MAG: hypothetical protein LBB83_05840 [Treponema sp.]|jgi:hypothetical protein|nr:hypothetical protein [Treponema sp.]